MTIEKLTDEDMRSLHTCMPKDSTVGKLVTAFDALTAENERLRAEVEGACIEAGVQRTLADAAERWRIKAVTMHDAAEARLAPLTAENERLRAELNTADEYHQAQWSAAEARLATLAAENERLRALNRANERRWLAAEREGMAAEARLATAEADNADLVLRYGENTERMILAEARLATAVGLLVEVLPFAKHWRPSTERAVHAFLASAQPAVPTRFERLVADVGELDVSVLASCAPPAAPASPDDYAAHARWCQPAAPARTEAEQAEQLVLQACREMNVDRDGVGWTRSQLDAVIEAVRVWRDRLGLK
jgi:hypothetical protein